VPKSGTYPVTLRAAIENSAMAVWLLTPDKSTERITRRLQQAAGDIRASEDVKELIQQTGPRSQEERLNDLRTIARSQGIDVKTALKAPGFRLIVRTAGEEVESGGTLAQAMWHVGSGTSHGDLWGSLSVPSSVEIPGSPLGVANLRLTVGMNSLAMMTVVATDLIAKGWDLFDQRGR
jgi:hypothetical protein